jgi:hypothetical protein
MKPVCGPNSRQDRESISLRKHRCEPRLRTTNPYCYKSAPLHRRSAYRSVCRTPCSGLIHKSTDNSNPIATHPVRHRCPQRDRYNAYRSVCMSPCSGPRRRRKGISSRFASCLSSRRFAEPDSSNLCHPVHTNLCSGHCHKRTGMQSPAASCLSNRTSGCQLRRISRHWVCTRRCTFPCRKHKGIRYHPPISQFDRNSERSSRCIVCSQEHSYLYIFRRSKHLDMSSNPSTRHRGRTFGPYCPCTEVNSVCTRPCTRRPYKRMGTGRLASKRC